MGVVKVWGRRWRFSCDGVHGGGVAGVRRGGGFAAMGSRSSLARGLRSRRCWGVGG